MSSQLRSATPVSWPLLYIIERIRLYLLHGECGRASALLFVVVARHLDNKVIVFGMFLAFDPRRNILPCIQLHQIEGGPKQLPKWSHKYIRIPVNAFVVAILIKFGSFGQETVFPICASAHFKTSFEKINCSV
jgi:hypothetical protein